MRHALAATPLGAPTGRAVGLECSAVVIAPAPGKAVTKYITALRRKPRDV